MTGEPMALEFHPAADLFPLLDSESTEFRDLVEDIRQHGQVEPIKLYEGKILDGRNRYRACAVAGIEPKTVTWTGDSPVVYVLSTNLHRRHLTDNQRAAIAVEALPMIEAETEAIRRAKQAETQRTGAAIVSDLTQQPSESESKSGSGASRKTAAQQFDVSEASVRRAKALKVADPEAFEEVKTGQTSLKNAEKRVRQSQRPAPTSSMPPGMTVKPPRPPREDPALLERLYKVVQSYPDDTTPKALAGEIQAADLNLPEDAIRKLRDHLKRTNSGRLALDRGLQALLNDRGNRNERLPERCIGQSPASRIRDA